MEKNVECACCRKQVDEKKAQDSRWYSEYCLTDSKFICQVCIEGINNMEMTLNL